MRTFAKRVLLLLCAGCAGSAPGEVRTMTNATTSERPVLVGRLENAAVVGADERWQRAYEGATAVASSREALAAVPPGGHVDVYLGTWCGDSVREVTRFLRYVEGAEPRFSYALIGVDRRKSAPPFTDGAGLRFVPTFVVKRGGEEVGRIVESAPNELGADLAALLSGASRGTLTGRAPE
jgi:hypothetical protein